ncbi:MAG: hypothetical protein NZT61_02270 [Deltaproteobacteria bacterium]|nr:hypothetical protein [Deltaproteobacteria bacterium]
MGSLSNAYVEYAFPNRIVEVGSAAASDYALKNFGNCKNFFATFYLENPPGSGKSRTLYLASANGNYLSPSSNCQIADNNQSCSFYVSLPTPPRSFVIGFQPVNNLNISRVDCHIHCN